MAKIKRKYRLKHYLREELLPTAFCPGCGCGTILNTYAQAIEKLQIDPKKIVSVTGIGCSSWIPSPYFKADTLHTTHGRAIAFATGVKIMKPGMNVVVIAGDGDIAGIGGNHLIHAARRNIGLSVFLVNNMIYGMTGGQVSPMTPLGDKTSTTPYGNPEYPFNIAELVAAAGANYVARWTTYHVFPLVESIQKAIKKDGFSFIEILTQCPISYGRRVGMRTAQDFFKYFKKNTVKSLKAKNMSPEELKDKIIIGEIVERDRKEFTAVLREQKEERQKSK